MNEITIVSYEDIDLFEGFVNILVEGYNIEHVCYYAEKEFIEEKGHIGSVHEVEMSFICSEIEKTTSDSIGIMRTRILAIPYRCTGLIRKPMVINNKLYFLLECGLQIIVVSYDLVSEVKEGQTASVQGIFEISFVESETYKAIRSLELESRELESSKK